MYINDNLVYIPKDSMNNIEKNLYEIYESFYYQANLEKLLGYMNERFTRITKQGVNDGLILDAVSERELVHRIMLEGLPYYIQDQLRNKLKAFEESISEQPMLLAHPSGIEKKELINYIESKYIADLVKNNYVIINEKLYSEM
jgi:hypothetical protein